jgi:hypothetical protein
MTLVLHTVSVIAEACICGAVLHFTALQPQRDKDQIAFVVMSFVMTLLTFVLNIAHVRAALLRLGYGTVGVAVDVARRVSSRTAKASSADGGTITQGEATLAAKIRTETASHSSATVMPIPT